jgi:palmitoyltransferase ZDHHC9/14/18
VDSPNALGCEKICNNRYSVNAIKSIRQADDDDSKCNCLSDCGDSCLNKITAYECDEGNCYQGGRCSNRQFSNLSELNNRWGVEVFNTGDRGKGLRSSGTIEPGAIFLEYIGEIITEIEFRQRNEGMYQSKDVGVH